MIDSSHTDVSDNVPRPTGAQIRATCLRAAIPFIGFGIFDNMVMLTVGDMIDATFGVTMGFSTMAAAGLGQCCSDATGITLQGFIERFSDKLGLPSANLTFEQERLSIVKTWVQIARTFGIVFGCLIGMFPLLFLNTNRRNVVDQVTDSLTPEQRAKFDSVMQAMSFEEGDKLLSHGSIGECMHVILHGEVEIVGRDNQGNPITVCNMGPGCIVGELEIVNDHPCVADVIATEPVRTHMITKKDFLDIVGKEISADIFRDNVKNSAKYVWYRMKME
eukprot:TRINITY_DN37854_c0_g1_i1.p1 TRINITY_DN37854_c0_g1~~TRINITY_DN37854_c0_g1_i1.p1  ORF type:complete len:290 (+),score=52.17 TRINITY_DN37854_c0_g1_i1:43-870(+)